MSYFLSLSLTNKLSIIFLLLAFCLYLIKLYQFHYYDNMLSYTLCLVISFLLNICVITIITILAKYHNFTTLILYLPLIIYSNCELKEDVKLFKKKIYLDYELYLEDIDSW